HGPRRHHSLRRAWHALDQHHIGRDGRAKRGGVVDVLALKREGRRHGAAPHAVSGGPYYPGVQPARFTRKYSSESASASHDASMTSVLAPTFVQRCSPSVDSMSTRTAELVPAALSMIRTLKSTSFCA